MKEAIALLIVMLMWAFAATRAEGADLQSLTNKTLYQVENQINTTQNDHNRSQTISILELRRSQNTDNHFITSTLDLIIARLVVEQEKNIQNPALNSLVESL